MLQMMLPTRKRPSKRSTEVKTVAPKVENWTDEKKKYLLKDIFPRFVTLVLSKGAWGRTRKVVKNTKDKDKTIRP